MPRGSRRELVAEGPAPLGGEVDLAIHMRPAPGWHGYWLNPGDAGLPMDVTWQLPHGFSAGPLRYPVPTRLEIAGLMNYVYESDYAVLVRIKVPANARGVVPLRAQAHWLACTDKFCVPEQGILSLDLPVGTGTPNRAQFDRVAAGAAPASGGDRSISRLPATSCASPSRCRPASRTGSPICSRRVDGPVDYERHAVVLPRRRHADRRTPAQRAGARAFLGVLALGPGQGLQFDAVPGNVPSGRFCAWG